MKNTFLPILLSALLISNSNLLAQEHEVAIKGGININDLGGKSIPLYSTLGFHGGFYYERIISSYFSIQPELTISLQGAAFDRSNDTKLNYTYLNIPLLGKFYLVDDLAFEIGPQLGVLLSAKEVSDFGNIDISDQVRNTDFSVIFGLGYKYRGRTSLTFRYNLGISNTNLQDVVYEARLTNRVFQISLAYIL